MPDFVTLFICCFVILIYITVPHNICCGQNTHCSTLLRIYGIKSRISQNLVWFGGGIVKSGNGMPTMNIHTHTKKFWFHMGTETSLYVFFNLWLAFISAFYTHRIKKNILQDGCSFFVNVHKMSQCGQDSKKKEQGERRRALRSSFVPPTKRSLHS